MVEKKYIFKGKSWFEKNPLITVAAILLVSLFVCAVCAELLLSIFSKNTAVNIIRYINLREHPPLSVKIAAPYGQYLSRTEGLESKQYPFRIDANGFIMPSEIHEKPDLSIVFLGGSTTECFFVDEELRFPYLAGRIVEKETGLKTNSYNSGVSGSNSLHSLDILLNKVLPMKPNIVLMMHNINDLTTLLRAKTYWNNLETRAPILYEDVSIKRMLRNLKNKTFPHLYLLIKNTAIGMRLVNENIDEFKVLRGNKLAIDKSFLVSEFSANLQIFIDICRARKVIPVLLTQENRLAKDPDKLILDWLKYAAPELSYSEYKDIYDLFNQTIRDVTLKNNVKLIDLAAKIPQNSEYLYDVVHLNRNGSKLAAQIISKEIKDIVENKNADSGKQKTANHRR